MFFFLSKTLDVLFAPMSWAIALVILGVWAARKKRTRLALGAPIAAVVVLSIFSLGPTANFLAVSLESSAKTTMKNDTTYDAVIVLGGLYDDAASTSWGQPSYGDAVERMLVAFDLLRTDRARFAIISGAAMANGANGASGGSGESEAAAIGRQLEAWGIDRARIVVEDRARNTHENAVESARIVRERGFVSLVLVTSAMHMKRAAGCFAATGLAFDSRAVDFRSHTSGFANSLFPRADALDLSTYALREHLGRVVYRVRGYSVSWP